MGNLRTDSTDDFPVESRDGNVGYVAIYKEPITKERSVMANPDAENPLDRFEKEEYEEHWEHFKSTKGEKESLLNRLQESDPDNVTLLGYWAGQWRTDMHVLELPDFQERMEHADL